MIIQWNSINLNLSIKFLNQTFYMMNNILKDSAVVTDIAGDYTVVKTKNHTISLQLVKLGFKLNGYGRFEKK